MKDYLTVKQAAVYLQTTTRNVRALCARGSLKAKKIGYTWFIHKTEVFRRLKQYDKEKSTV